MTFSGSDRNHKRCVERRHKTIQSVDRKDSLVSAEVEEEMFRIFVFVLSCSVRGEMFFYLVVSDI